MPIAEIAELRSARVGTVKAQSAAVHRTACVNSRAERMSLFMEDLMLGVVLDSAPLHPGQSAEAAVAARSDVAMQQPAP